MEQTDDLRQKEMAERDKRWWKHQMYMINKYYISSFLLLLLVGASIFFWQRNELIKAQADKAVAIAQKDSLATAKKVAEIKAQQVSLKKETEQKLDSVTKDAVATAHRVAKAEVEAGSKTVNRRISSLEVQQKRIVKRLKTVEDSLYSSPADKQKAMRLLSEANKQIVNSFSYEKSASTTDSNIATSTDTINFMSSNKETDAKKCRTRWWRRKSP